MKEFLEILNIKPTHFHDGWASFDAINYYQLSQACVSGCRLKLAPNTLRSKIILHEHPELMCFGKVSNNGDIIIQGISGFPGDNTCVRYLKDISGSARKSKIDDNYVYVEW